MEFPRAVFYCAPCGVRFYGELVTMEKTIYSRKEQDFMKKRIMKRKKQIRVYKKRKHLRRLAVLAAILILSLSMTLAVHGESGTSQLPHSSGSAPRTVVTDIYHKHIGSAASGGGCYQEAIPHVHQGNETDGGECFGAPVYHTHLGNSQEEGGCYNQPVYHVHEGDEQSGGDCYAAITHVHDDSCYEEAICTVYYAKGNVLETFTDDCFDHSRTTYESAEGTATHMDCGKGEESLELVYCQICGIYSPRYHGYQKLICGLDEGDTVGYELSCPKTEQDIEFYETGCNKDDTSVDYYACTCQKSVEGYGRNCGIDENVPCGRLIVANETEGQKDKVDISVRIEDLTGGRLILSDNPYVWYDEEGRQIGQGERIEVSENGNYSVTVKLENRDVDESELRSGITVDNIYKETGVSTPSPAVGTPAPGENRGTPTPGNGDDASTSAPPEESEGEPENAAEEPEENPEENPDEGSRESVPTPKASPDRTNNQADHLHGDTGSEGAEAAKSLSIGQTEETAAASPDASPEQSPERLTVTKKTETLPELSAVNDVALNPETVKKEGGIFADPVVKVVTLAFGAFAVIAGILFLLWYLRRSVKIYNDDGEGRMLYLGRCLVRLEEEGYAITISDQMIEHAYTNRYCIKPGLFLIGRKEGEELLVCSENRRIAVYLCREMIVVIDGH